MKSVFTGIFLAWIFTVNAQTISVQQQTDDFDTLCSTLEQVHPDIFLYQPEKRYVAVKDSIKTLFVKETTLSNYYLKIAPLLASIKDGHTMLMPPVTKERTNFMQTGGLTLPLRLKSENNKLIVDFPLTETSIATDDIILSINGIKTEVILSKLYSLFGSEKTNATKDGMITQYLSTLLWYMFDWGSDFQLTVKRDNEIWEENLPGISQAQAVPILQKKLSSSSKQFTYELSPDEQTATITISNFYQEAALKQFCDSAFSVINAKAVPNLIIDIRNNSGGSSNGVDILMSYLPHKEYSLYTKSEIKISESSKAYNEKRHPDTYKVIKDLPNGTLYRLSESKSPGNLQESDVYKGNISVLVNEKTYSGASTFAHAIQSLGIGKIIGETGCPDIYFGNFLSFELPNSKFKYYIAFCKFYE